MYKFIVFLLLLSSTVCLAMWAPLSDEQLVEEADLIVYGEYLGESELNVVNKGVQLNVAVLNPSIILKGGQVQILAPIFIKRYNSRLPVSSDKPVFKRGQLGLWFLNKEAGFDGVYKISHPAQYRKILEAGNELRRWQELLN